MSPSRIQLRRTKGWRLPEGCINVARPTAWGNPFKVGAPHPGHGWPMSRAEMVEQYRGWLGGAVGETGFAMTEEARVYLGGHDLACWCPLDEPCHADVLLEVANPRLLTFDPDWCMRPGVCLREMMDHSGLTGDMGVRIVAKLAGLDTAVIEGILDGSVVITEEIANHLAAGTQPLAISAQFWLNFERTYRAGLAAGKTDVSAEYG